MNELELLLSGLDAPGAMVRSGVGSLVGANSTGNNALLGATPTGRDILEAMGVLGANEEGFDAGDVLGFGADMLLSPGGLGGAAYGAAKLGKAGQAAMQSADDFGRAANRIRGGMDDVAGLGQIQKGAHSDDLMEMLGQTSQPRAMAPSPAQLSGHLDAAGGLMGTPNFIAPEQVAAMGQPMGAASNRARDFLRSMTSMSRQADEVPFENVLSDIVRPPQGSTKIYLGGGGKLRL